MTSSTIQKKAFFVYKASAGAGKTYNLALRYISICLDQFENNRFAFEKILAITFTNKAVGEMKERILKFLEILSSPSGTDSDSAKRELIGNLQLEKQLTDNEIGTRAQNILKNILENYSRFSIMTIDKFYQLILNNYAFELQIPSNYRLELDEKVFMQQMVDLLLAQLGEDDRQELTNFVLKFMQQRIAEGSHWKIEKSLAQMGKQLYSDDAFHYLKNIWNNETSPNNLENFRKLIEKIRKTVEATDNEIKSLAKNCIAQLPEQVDLKRDFAHGSNGFGNWLLQVAENGMRKAIHTNSYILEAVNNDKWVAAKASDVAERAILSSVPTLKESYFEIRQAINKKGKIYFLYLNILKNIYPFALLNELYKISEKIKLSDHQMMIGETNRQIAKVVTSEDVPFIYEQLGEKYRHFFIDEFQDTSLLQWHNLLPLVTESLSKEEEEERGSVFLFGDAKQAIYRFRSGDVRQFMHLSNLDHESVSNMEILLKDGFGQISLKKNHRSAKEIIRFNNEWFSFRLENHADNPHVAKAYQDFMQEETPRTPSGGGVCVWLHEKTTASAYEDCIKAQTLNAIRTCHDEAGFAYAQIAVLTRSNDLSAKIAQYLIDQQIPVISSESLLLSQSPEVRFFIHCITLVRQPEHPLVRAFILYQLAIWNNEDNPESFLSRGQTVQEFEHCLSEWGIQLHTEKWKYLNLYELFQAIRQHFASCLAPSHEKANPYVMALGEVIWNYQNNLERKEEDFLSFWEENKGKLSLSNPENIDAVHLMSIHKSKGLEFPVVIYPIKQEKSGYTQPRQWMDLQNEHLPIALNTVLLELNEDLSHTQFADWVTNEAEMTQLDQLNLEYVAFTRAKQRLYLIAQKPSPLEQFFKTVVHAEGVQETESLTQYLFPQDASFSNNTEKKPVEKPALGFNSRTNWQLPPLAIGSEQAHPEAERGTLIHQCLSMLYRPSDKERVASFVKKSGSIPEADKQFMFQLLENICHEPLLFGNPTIQTAGLNQPSGQTCDAGPVQIYTETEIMAANGETFRFDRLLRQGRHYWLFDYKTGQPVSSHFKQMERYRNLLQKADHEAEIEVYIVYIQDDAALKFHRYDSRNC